MNFVDVGCAILAAGQSTRMGKGKSKPLLSWKDTTLVESLATQTEDLFMQSFVCGQQSQKIVRPKLPKVPGTHFAGFCSEASGVARLLIYSLRTSTSLYQALVL